MDNVSEQPTHPYYLNIYYLNTINDGSKCWGSNIYTDPSLKWGEKRRQYI